MYFNKGDLMKKYEDGDVDIARRAGNYNDKWMPASDQDLMDIGLIRLSRLGIVDPQPEFTKPIKEEQLEIKPTLGQNLRAHRKTEGWSQAYVGDQLEVSDTTVSNWELGKQTPGKLELKELAEMYGTTTDELKGER